MAALILALCSMSMTSAAKLYFRFGCVSSAKTLNLLAMAHSFRRQQKAVLLMKVTSVVVVVAVAVH